MWVSVLLIWWGSVVIRLVVWMIVFRFRKFGNFSIMFCLMCVCCSVCLSSCVLVFVVIVICFLE